MKSTNDQSGQWRTEMSKSKLLVVALSIVALSASSLAMAATENPNTSAPALVDAVTAAGAEQIVATVKSINSLSRKLVLEMPDGVEVETTVKRDMKNLKNVNPGDKVVLDKVEFLGVAVENVGTELKGTAEMGEKTVAPETAGLPGETFALARDAIGTVQKIDADTRTLTIDIGAGRMRTVPVSDDVDLSDIKAGDTVKARYVEETTISLVSENPMKPIQ